MSSISSCSLAEALRRAYPCLPRVFLPSGSMVVRGRGDRAAPTKHAGTVKEYSSEGDNSSQGKRKTSGPVFIPLVRGPCYFCADESKEVLLTFTQSGELIDDVAVEKKKSISVAGALKLQTPTVTIPFIRCEGRINITDCMRTRYLQKELRRTENELCVLYKAACRSLSADASDNAQKSVEDSLIAEDNSSRMPQHMQLRWDNYGWDFEDPTLAEQQSKHLPLASDTGGDYWSAWIVPFKAPFITSSVVRVRDIRHFLLEDYLTLINMDAVHHYLATKQKLLFSMRAFRDSPVDYWASTGEPVYSTAAESSVTTSNNGDADEAPYTSSPVRSPCWFTVSELTERRLQVRSGGKLSQQPISYNGCGFFLHKAPWWFLMSREEVLQECPLSLDTLQRLPAQSEYDNKDNITAAIHGLGSLRGEIVFVLVQPSTWRMYPRRSAVMNFHQNISDTNESSYIDDMSSMDTVFAPLIFIDINEAVRLMQIWSRLQKQKRRQQQEDNMHTVNEQLSVKEKKKNEEDEKERILDFFASLPSSLSAAVFINSFITHCARALNSAPTALLQPTLTEVIPASTGGGEIADVVCEEKTQIMLNTENTLEFSSHIDQEPQHNMAWNTPLPNIDHNNNSDDDNCYAHDEDFPAVDRRIYGSAHRLNKAYTHPREEYNQLTSINHAPNLTSTVAKEIIKAIEQRSKCAPSSPTSEESSQAAYYNIDDEVKDVVWDIGIVWLSIHYTIPAVNALDTEIIP